jgi:hypothetical protein
MKKEWKTLQENPPIELKAQTFFSGTHNGYYWIEWVNGNIGTLLTEAPELFIAHYLVNTSLDSRTIKIGGEYFKKGWRNFGELAISPPIMDVDEIPSDQFDEWYILKSPPVLNLYAGCEVFVNYAGFSLHSIQFKETQTRFWNQIDKILPDAYVSEGDNLIFVTQEKKVIEKIVQIFNTLT